MEQYGDDELPLLVGRLERSGPDCPIQRRGSGCCGGSLGVTVLVDCAHALSRFYPLSSDAKTLQTMAIGREDWLFAGSEAGGGASD